MYNVMTSLSGGRKLTARSTKLINQAPRVNILCVSAPKVPSMQDTSPCCVSSPLSRSCINRTHSIILEVFSLEMLADAGGL